MSAQQQLKLEGVYKSYNGASILQDVNLQVNNGDIYTLIGKNGVGKSTLLQLIVGLNTPDKGEIQLNGHAIITESSDWKKNIGVALSTENLIETLTIEEYLTLLGGIYDLEKSVTKSRTKSLISYFYEDNEKIAKPIKDYSSGMKKKALLCAALVHNPAILLLDEPFTFLDPASCSRLCDFLVQQKELGKIILLSSHDLLYIDKISTRIGVLDSTKLILDDIYENFKQENDFFKDNKMLKKILNYNSKDLSLLEEL